MGETRFVMGCISQLQDGRYFLEDLSDALPIDLSEAQTTSGFFTGGCCPSTASVLSISAADESSPHMAERFMSRGRCPKRVCQIPGVMQCTLRGSHWREVCLARRELHSGG